MGREVKEQVTSRSVNPLSSTEAAPPKIASRICANRANGPELGYSIKRVGEA
jgi:hypothetical protein